MKNVVSQLILAAWIVIGLCTNVIASSPDSLVYFDLLPAHSLAFPPVSTLNPHGEIAIPCEACHTPEAWTPLRKTLDFDHSEQTRFVMTGRHAEVACANCHLDLRFDRPNFTADDCASCHLDVHRGQLGDDCQSCHNTEDFGLTNGTLIHAQTSFPLTGSHLQVTCETCHTEALDGLFAPLDTDCFACHAPEYQNAASIDHIAAGFSTDCAQCHTTLAFSSAGGFNHAAAAGGFTLVGTHAEVQCAACHTVPGFEPIFAAAEQDDCFACHQDDYDRAGDPDHAAAGFPTDCAQCHTVTVWENADFEHVMASDGFALIGAHQPLPCSACHVGADFEVLEDPSDQNDCFACHAREHEEEHPDFPTDCLQCHTVETWDDADFDHNTTTDFSLVGAHVSLPCSSCHVGNDFEVIFDTDNQDDCFACHAAEHEAEHPSLPTDCLQCHTVETWEDADFDHATIADGFALVGAHQPLPCSACHVGLDFEVIFDTDDQNDCFACHAREHEEEHADFPTDCLQCHTVETWEDADFDHGTATEFALVGAHVSLPCSSCHTGPDFDLAFEPSGQNDCVACHQADTDDAHYGFPSDCLQCHTVDTWDDADFDHASFFPINSGSHAGTWDSCQTCHTQPANFEVFSCLTCHEHNREEMDDKHEDVGDYVYESNACLQCHPDGEENRSGVQFGR